MKIAICASFSFYAHVSQIEDELLVLGHTPLIPATAKAMKLSGKFTKDPLLTTTGGIDLGQKTNAMREHFGEIARADSILVVNDEKHNQLDYIGPNVLMEMAVAFSLQKPIYLLYDIPTASSFLDEINGLEPIALHGDMRAIP